MSARQFLVPLLIALAHGLQAQAPAPVTPELEPLDPSALEALRAKVGETIAVQGTIAKDGENKAGTIRYLNFTQNYRESVSLVFFTSKSPDEFTKEKVSAWVGKKLKATGKLSDFNGQLQITIEKWDQIVDVP